LKQNPIDCNYVMEKRKEENREKQTEEKKINIFREEDAYPLDPYMATRTFESWEAASIGGRKKGG
jgi:hypothetical protein